jgi:PilZ domain-containing protein
MARVEELTFSELVQELSQYEHDSGPPDLEKAIRRRSIDARLMRLLSADTPADERRTSVRVPGELPVKIYVGEKMLAGTILDLAEGGMRVNLAHGPVDGDTVDVELEGGGDKPSRATAKVTWKKPGDKGLDIGLHFDSESVSHRQRLRRLVLEILRRMPAPS